MRRHAPMLASIILSILAILGGHALMTNSHTAAPLPHPLPPLPRLYIPTPTTVEVIMINPKHLENLVIRPTLKKLAAYDARMDNQASVDLMLGTAAQESDMGFSLTQLGSGPARGIYQMEGATHRSLWRHYLSKPAKMALREILLGMVPDTAVTVEADGYTYVDDHQLVVNLEYSTAIARVRYWQAKDPLPQAGDLVGLGEFYKKHYNTASGAATPADFVASWKQFVVANN